MNRNRCVRIATIALGIAGLSCITRPLLAQRHTADSLAIEIAAALSDTAVVSPITGARVPIDAVRLAVEAITASTPEALSRLGRALSPSGTKNALITQLLASLSQMRAEPSFFRVQLAMQAFNEFVNAASPTYLVSPPNEFLALHAVLVRISAFATGVLLPRAVRARTTGDSSSVEVWRTSFAPWLGVDLAHSRQTWSGTFVRDLVEGHGGPSPENMRGAQIALRLWLADGTPLINPARDPSVLQPMTPPIGDAVSFVVNRHEVMPGLEDGVRGMRPGGVRQLVIPSSAGFGPTGRMSVPPNAVLVAEVKLLMAAYDPVR